MSKGWHRESRNHGLCAKGIKVRKPKMRAEGREKRVRVPELDKSFVGLDEFTIKEYPSVGRF